MPRKKSTGKSAQIETDDFRKSFLLMENAIELTDFSQEALITAEKFGIKAAPVKNLTLSPQERETLLEMRYLSKTMRNKLTKDEHIFTIADISKLTKEVAENVKLFGLIQQVDLLRIGKNLAGELEAEILHLCKIANQKAKQRNSEAASNGVYQFKITLRGSNPPIWRQIQTEDCTLDVLHEHIQTAMGWTNSHLHQFEIFKQQYADPGQFDSGFDDFNCIDSTSTKLSQIIPDVGKRFSFQYEYDFGDSWEHEIRFEGSKKKEPRTKYPLCLDGAGACPPEDVGGIYGYYDLLARAEDPEEYEDDDYMDWVGELDPDKFDAKQATKEMRKGLPHW